MSWHARTTNLLRYQAPLTGAPTVGGWLAGLAADELGVEEDEVLYVASHELALGDRRVKLTMKEFEVFLYLYGYGNTPVTRASLIGQVWGAKVDNRQTGVAAGIPQLKTFTG